MSALGHINSFSHRPLKIAKKSTCTCFQGLARNNLCIADVRIEHKGSIVLAFNDYGTSL